MEQPDIRGKACRFCGEPAAKYVVMEVGNMRTTSYHCLREQCTRKAWGNDAKGLRELFPDHDLVLVKQN